MCPRIIIEIQLKEFFFIHNEIDVRINENVKKI